MSLEKLAQIVKHRDVINGGILLARTPDGEMVVGENDTIERIEEDGQARYKFWMRVYHTDGRTEMLLPIEQIGEQVTYHQIGIASVTDDQPYREFYDLWAEAADTPDEREQRKAIVAAHWLAVGLRPLDGE